MTLEVSIFRNREYAVTVRFVNNDPRVRGEHLELLEHQGFGYALVASVNFHESTTSCRLTLPPRIGLSLNRKRFRVRSLALRSDKSTGCYQHNNNDMTQTYSQIHTEAPQRRVRALSQSQPFHSRLPTDFETRAVVNKTFK